MRPQIFLAVVVGALSATCTLRAIGQTADTSYSTIKIDPQAPIGSAKNPVRVSSGIMFGLSINRPKPIYPKIARDEHVAGAVVMRATISPEGKVDQLEVISGPEVLRQAYLDAVRQWTFKPYLLNGTPTWVQTTITINIQMGG